ncbi:MAG: SDR family oxidoreductase, partial [Solirubrobacterales bacterium]
ADTGQWRQMMDVNVLGLLYCTQAALPHLRDSGHGHIVNVSSVAGRTASAFVGVYNATKWAVTGFSEALRQEAAMSKIRVTCIEPGMVETELPTHNTNPAVLETIEKLKAKYGEALESEDIADAILHAVTAPPRVNVNEVLIRPSGQVS